MLKVGITGGIGSGKTTVCQIFEVLGIPIYYADTRAKQLMTENKELVKQVKILFGENAYTDDGSLNRKHIASIAFRDRSKLALLNAVIHPAVAADTQEWFSQQTEKPFAIQEAALMFESGSYKKLDYIITVTAPLEVRLSRVMKRDQAQREEVLSRMKNQMKESEKVERADVVIYNDPEHSLIRQVLFLYHQFVELDKHESGILNDTTR